MPLGSLFKIMVALTLFYAYLQIFAGLDVLGIIILLLIIDVAAYRLDKAIRKHEILEDAKISSFKTDFQTFSENANKKLENITPTDFGEQLKSHKDDVTNLIDRLARKGLDLENKIVELRKTIGAVYGAIDDRLKVAENHLGIRKEEEEKELEEPIAIPEESTVAPEEPVEAESITVAQQSIEYVDELSE